MVGNTQNPTSTNYPIARDDSATSLATSEHPVEKYCAVGDQMIIEYKDVRYFTKFRGARDEFVIPEAYGAGSKKPTLLKETSFLLIDLTKKLAAANINLYSKLTARFIAEGKVYSFHTAIQGEHAHPPLLSLDYPETLERRNLRVSERFITIIPMTFHVAGDGKECEGAVKDISHEGARLCVLDMDGIKERGKIHVSMTLPSGAKIAKAEMLVQHVVTEGEKHYLGAKFTFPDPAVTSFYDKCMRTLG